MCGIGGTESGVEPTQDNPSSTSAAIERQLTRDASAVSRIISPEAKLSVSDMTDIVSKTIALTDKFRNDTAQARLQLATETNTLHELYRQVLTTAIRLLEQTMHGSVARGSRAKAEYLSLVAEGMAKKFNVQHRQLLTQVYSEEVQEMLKQRYEGATREERTVRRKIGEAEEKLAQYRAGRGTEGVASEYAEILREMGKVEGEISRLQSGKR